MSKQNKPQKEGRGEVPSTQKPEKPMEPPIRIIKESKSEPEKPKSIEEKLAEHEALIAKKATEVQMLEEQHRQMLYEKNEPIYILTGYIFKAFCSDEEAHVQWETEKAMASGLVFGMKSCTRRGLELAKWYINSSLRTKSLCACNICSFPGFTPLYINVEVTNKVAVCSLPRSELLL